MKSKFSQIVIAVLLTTFMAACTANTVNPQEPVVSNTESESIMQATANLDDLTDEYLAPLGLASISSLSWDNAANIPSHNLGLFYVAKISLITSESIDWDTTPHEADEVESLIMQYFDVTPEYIRTSEYYNSDDNTYVFESFGGAASFKVVDSKMENEALILDYEYYSPADDVSVIREGIITVAIDGNSYKYISCNTEAID